MPHERSCSYRECAALLPCSLVFLSRDWEVHGFPRKSASLLPLEIAVFCLACGWRDEAFQEPQINTKYSSESQNSAYCRCWWFLQLHFLGLCVGFLQLCVFPRGICVSPLQNLRGDVCRDSATKALQRCREGPEIQFCVVGDLPSAICVLSTTAPWLMCWYSESASGFLVVFPFSPLKPWVQLLVWPPVHNWWCFSGTAHCSLWDSFLWHWQGCFFLNLFFFSFWHH